MRSRLFGAAATITLLACALLVSVGSVSAGDWRHYWSPCITSGDLYGPAYHYGFGIPWHYIPPPEAPCEPHFRAAIQAPHHHRALRRDAHN